MGIKISNHPGKSNAPRPELVSRLATRFPQFKDADLSVTALLAAMTDTLRAGQRIEIQGLDSFQLNYRPARLGRNSKTGDRVEVSAKYAPHFKGGKELRGCEAGRSAQ